MQRKRVAAILVAMTMALTGCRTVDMFQWNDLTTHEPLFAFGWLHDITYHGDVPAGVIVVGRNCNEGALASQRMWVAFDPTWPHATMCDHGTALSANVGTIGPHETFSLAFETEPIGSPDPVVSVYAVGGSGEILEVLA